MSIFKKSEVMREAEELDRARRPQPEQRGTKAEEKAKNHARHGTPSENGGKVRAQAKKRGDRTP